MGHEVRTDLSGCVTCREGDPCGSPLGSRPEEGKKMTALGATTQPRGKKKDQHLSTTSPSTPYPVPSLHCCMELHVLVLVACV